MVTSRKEGEYLFDIFNLTYLLDGDNITTLSLDRQKQEGDRKEREIQYSTIDKEGILASYTTYIAQKGSKKPCLSEEAQTLQVYTAQQLEDMLVRNGFMVLETCGCDASPFDEHKTESILMIAQKVL